MAGSHPYIPNSAPAVRVRMLEEIGVESEEALFADIPARLRLQRPLRLPEPFPDEVSLRRHVEGLLGKNRTCLEYLSFLGAGCAQHFVPAVCDEINQRGEFLTAYAGEPYEDHGRFQALFEYASMMGELLSMDVVNVPTFHGFQAAATALRMAARITGREEALVPALISPDKLSFLRNYCRPDVALRTLPHEPGSGLIDLEALEAAITERTAAVYFESPSYLGIIERGPEITTVAHARGALAVASVDPISLGVLRPPGDYGVDIACGDIQPLGIHMQFGGGHGGFIATRDEAKFVCEFPSRLFGVAPTAVEGEYGFGDVAYHRTSFVRREQGKEFVGTAAALWGITAGVYLALMGPQGILEIGEAILGRSHYAARRLGAIPGVRAPALTGPFFKEFVVSFEGASKSVAAINRALLERGILGGKDLTREFSEFRNAALYCVTELHTREDIDRLAAALTEALG